MRIAVLSGKGGTGKTLLAVNLAAVAENALYLDCDVEEPNGRLFLKPQNVTETEISVKIPRVDAERCTGCRKCVDFCRFNAMAYTRGKLLIFDEVCHSCGGCVMLCPDNALQEVERPVGKVQSGASGGIRIFTGILNTGEASGMPLIKKLLQETADGGESVFIDCPPGSGCAVMESVRNADFCVLVAEPTIYGAHNLEMVYEVIKLLEKPCAAVLNKCTEGDNPSEILCDKYDIPIMGRIAFERELGMMNADGKIAALENGRYHALFSGLLCNILKEAGE